MTKNVEEIVKVPATFVIDIKTLTDDLKKKVLASAACKDADEKAKLEGELVAELPTEIKTQLDAVGARLPTDMIDIGMRLGDFLFSLFVYNVKPAQAPLTLKRHERRVMELAELFDADEFVVPESVLKDVEPFMEDPDKWAKTQFSAFIKVGEEKKFLSLTSVGAGIFGKILDAAVALWIAPLPPKAAPAAPLAAVPDETKKV
jgi:hypothetical protein